MSRCPCPYHPWGCFGHPTECRCAREGAVTIPRAQHEALMGALEKHKLIAKMQTSQHTTYADFSAAKHHAKEAIKIARAAGIDLEEKHG